MIAGSVLWCSFSSYGVPGGFTSFHKAFSSTELRVTFVLFKPYKWYKFLNFIIWKARFSAVWENWKTLANLCVRMSLSGRFNFWVRIVVIELY